MKKFATAALLFTLVFSTFITSFAQKTRSGIKPAVRTDSVQFDAIDAVSDGHGVVIRWQMEVETNNVGFYVYRLGGKGLQKVNDILIPGSVARIKDRPLYGEKYETYDPDGTANTVYVIQYLTVDGRRVSSNQLSTKSIPNLAALTGRSKESYETAAVNRNGDISTTRLSENGTPSVSQPDSDLANHLWVVSQPGAKISVKSEGLYRVTRAELQAAGFAVNNNSANWRLFLEGIEQPIIVGTGDQYIEFYGKGIDAVESDTRVYYLIADATIGKRIGTRVLPAFRGYVGSNSYRVNTEKKERISYVSNILNGDADNYWGSLVSSSPTVIPFAITGIDFTARNIPVTIKMQGFTTGGPHSIRVVINNTEVGSITGDGAVAYSGQILVPSNLLIEGSNNLELTSMASAGDYSLFDSVTVNYDKKYQADQQELKFNSPLYKRSLLTGFASSDVRLFDVSGEGETSEILGLPIQQNGCSYEVKIPSNRSTVLFAQGATPTIRTAPSTAWTPSSTPFSTDGGIVTIAGNAFFTGMKARVSTTGTLPTGMASTTDYYVRKTGCDTLTLYDTYEHAVTPSKLAGLVKFCSTSSGTCSAGSGDHTITPEPLTKAASVTQNNPSTLSSTNRNAPMVIISYSDPAFIAASNAWANYRRSAAGGGFGVEVVDVADIYDEYSYGSLSSAAIKNFLSYAKDHWQTRYVLLMGDATYDPRNYQGFGAFDLIPTKFVNTAYGEFGSDEALADFNNDGLADLAIGRIPARTAQVITNALGKTTAFETPSMQSLSRGSLFAYDNPNTYDFQSMSQIMSNELPANAPKSYVQADSSGRAILLSELNSGKYIVNYSGHGATGLWGNSAFFTVNDVPPLTNANSQSIFTMMSCFNGNFTGLQFDSLSEALLKAQNGGGVATWSSTGETTPDVQLYMAQQFYNRLAAGTQPRIGDLIINAKAAIPPWGGDVKTTWALLGDPALKIR